MLWPHAHPEDSPEQHPELLPAESEDLFEASAETRPAASLMASLILRGVGEAQLLAAGTAHGYRAPNLGPVMHETVNALPYLARLAYQLADRFGNRHILFAGRDAEQLHDTYAVAYPSNQATLLPASTDLWESESMADNDLAASFLDTYNLTLPHVLSKETMLVDTGFQGTIGWHLWRRLSSLHGVRAQKIRRRLPIYLVSADQNALWGRQLMDFDDEAAGLQADPFPRVSRIKHGYVPFDAHEYPLTQNLATSMQLMPRYHGAYQRLEERDGIVQALPETAAQDIGLATNPSQLNDSIVNPLAAALVQHRVIGAVL